MLREILQLFLLAFKLPFSKKEKKQLKGSLLCLRKKTSIWGD